MLHLALLLAALSQADADPAPATMLRLYEGAILWGSIESHDAEGLAFVRLDNGGRVRLPWTRRIRPRPRSCSRPSATSTTARTS